MVDKEVILALVALIGTVIGLFGWTLKFVLQENAKREEGYRKVITGLTNEVVPIVKETHGMVRKVKMKVLGEGQ